MRGLCQDKILSIKSLYPAGSYPTVDLIRSYFVPPASPAVLHLKNELESDQVYEGFLLAMMKMEALSRQESSQRRKIKAAKFPYVKIIYELGMARFEYIDSAFIHYLGTCDFVSKVITSL